MYHGVQCVWKLLVDSTNARVLPLVRRDKLHSNEWGSSRGTQCATRARNEIKLSSNRRPLSYYNTPNILDDRDTRIKYYRKPPNAETPDIVVVLRPSAEHPAEQGVVELRLVDRDFIDFVQKSGPYRLAFPPAAVHEIHLSTPVDRIFTWL